MTEVQLRKAEEEVSRLEQELNMLKDSMNTRDACKECVAAGAEHGTWQLARLAGAAVRATGPLPAYAPTQARLTLRRWRAPGAPRRRLVDDVLKREEPYGVEKEDGSNPWTRPPPNAACCVIV